MKMHITLLLLLSLPFLTSCQQPLQTKAEAHQTNYPVNQYQVVMIKGKVHLAGGIMFSATIGPFSKINDHRYEYHDPQHDQKIPFGNTSNALLCTRDGKNWFHVVGYMQSIPQPIDVTGSPLDTSVNKAENATQNMAIIEVLGYDDKPIAKRTAHLKYDYGYIIHGLGLPALQFHVFDRIKKRRFKTKSWDTFYKAIQALPNGIKIDAIQRCTAPFSYAKPQDKFENFERILKEKSITPMFADDDKKHINLCTCESNGIRILFDK